MKVHESTPLELGDFEITQHEIALEGSSRNSMRPTEFTPDAPDEVIPESVCVGIPFHGRSVVKAGKTEWGSQLLIIWGVVS